jgi:hypothetical protein
VFSTAHQRTHARCSEYLSNASYTSSLFVLCLLVLQMCQVADRWGAMHCLGTASSA